MAPIRKLSFLEELEGSRTPQAFVEKELGLIFKDLLNLDEIPERHENLQDLGLTSLKHMQLKNKMQDMVQEKEHVIIGPAELEGCYSLSQFSERFLELIAGDRVKVEERATKERIQLMLDDSKLPEHIQILDDCKPATPVDQVRHIFLTGATGNMGPYYVQQLSKLNQITQMTCLVRRNATHSGEERLKDRLRSLDLLQDTDFSKISCVEGDVTRDLFGLDRATYDRLAREAEAIVHIAVFASHLEMYGKGASHHVGIRAVNVEGTIRILEFAVKEKVKHIMNFSTVGAVWVKDMDIPETLTTPEFWPTDGDFDEAPNFGYAISKWICDNLCGKAVARGLPCKVFRLPKIFGTNDTGRFEVKDNHFVIKFMYFVKSGVMPDVPVPLHVIPVDTSTKMCIDLFFNPEAPNEIYNILSINACREPESISKLTHEYGPVLRLACHLWKLQDELKLSVLTKDWSQFEKALIARVQKQDGMDMTPFMAFVKEQINLSGELELNPSLLLENDKIREFLSQNYGYEMRMLPYHDFVTKLRSEGREALLHTWMEFYTRPDPLYIMIPRTQFREDSFVIRNITEWTGNSTAKVTKFIPNISEVLQHPLTVVRKSFEYVLANSIQVMSGIFEDVE